MPLQNSINDREMDKFVHDPVRGTVVKVDSSGSTGGSFSLAGLGIGVIRQINLDAVNWFDVTAYLVSEGVGSGINYVYVQNITGDGSIVLWNYRTNDADQSVGVRIEDGGYRTTLLKDSVTSKVYIKMLSGSGTVTLEGLAP